MKHIGTKIINAHPMTRQQYNDLRGRTVPADENPGDDGYLVEYLDGGSANHPNYTGYISWSPKEVFDRAYRPATAMTFGDALVMLKAGKRVCRAGWNGKNIWLALTLSIHDIPLGGTVMPVYRLTLDDGGVGATALPWVGIKTADNKFVPWLASQTDMLAEDWMIAE